MIWITLIAVVTFIVLYFVFRKIAGITGIVQKTKNTSAFGFIFDYPKTSILIMLGVFALSFYQYKNHIYNMYDCSVQKTIHKAANSEYSWYNGECNFQDKNGVFINMQRVRGLPEGTTDHTDNDNN